MAGRVPVRWALPESSRVLRLGRAPGWSQAAGKAGPERELLFAEKIFNCNADEESFESRG